jgi:hypothetical protein
MANESHDESSQDEGGIVIEPWKEVHFILENLSSRLDSLTRVMEDTNDRVRKLETEVQLVRNEQHRQGLEITNVNRRMINGYGKDIDQGVGSVVKFPDDENVGKTG